MGERLSVKKRLSSSEISYRAGESDIGRCACRAVVMRNSTRNLIGNSPRGIMKPEAGEKGGAAAEGGSRATATATEGRRRKRTMGEAWVELADLTRRNGGHYHFAYLVIISNRKPFWQ